MTGSVYSIIKSIEKHLGRRVNPESSFDDRVLIQKIVYLIKTLANMPLNIHFSLYHHGPYSPKLAEIYYSANLREEIEKSPPLIKELDDLVSFLVPKELKWLKVAATLMDVYMRTGDKERTVRIVSEIKNVPEERAREILEELLSLRRFQ